MKLIPTLLDEIIHANGFFALNIKHDLQYLVKFLKKKISGFLRYSWDLGSVNTINVNLSLNLRNYIVFSLFVLGFPLFSGPRIVKTTKNLRILRTACICKILMFESKNETLSKTNHERKETIFGRFCREKNSLFFLSQMCCEERKGKKAFSKIRRVAFFPRHDPFLLQLPSYKSHILCELGCEGQNKGRFDPKKNVKYFYLIEEMFAAIKFIGVLKYRYNSRT